MSAISGFCEKCNKFRKRHCDGNRNTCMSILFDTIEALRQENEQLQARLVIEEGDDKMRGISYINEVLFDLQGKIIDNVRMTRDYELVVTFIDRSKMRIVLKELSIEPPVETTIIKLKVVMPNVEVKAIRTSKTSALRNKKS